MEWCRPPLGIVGDSSGGAAPPQVTLLMLPLLLPLLLFKWLAYWDAVHDSQNLCVS